MASQREDGKSVELRMDSQTLSVTINALSYMSENYNIAGVIDHAAWIISREEVDSTLAVLQPYQQNREATSPIRMSRSQWNVLVRMIDYAGYAAPDLKDRILLEELYDLYSEYDD